MPISITEDLIKGARFRRTSAGGVFTRIFYVEGLDRTRGENTYLASVAVDGTTGFRVPQYGEYHPTISGIAVNDVQSDPLEGSRTQCIVTITYVSPQISTAAGWTIEIAGADGVKTINRWPVGFKLAGEAILVGYNIKPKGFSIPINPKAINFQQDAENGLYYDYVQLPVLSPNMMLIFTRQRVVKPGNGTLYLNQQYRRKTNVQAWNGGDVGTWLCRNITGTSIGSVAGQPLMEEKFSFEYDPDGWTHVEYFRSLVNGRIPSGISILQNDNNGYIKIAPYNPADFTTVGFPPVY